MENERDLFEARVELKKFKKLNPKRVLQILKTIRECTAINRQWIRKTRITKTLVRMAQHKFIEQDELRTMITKLSRFLVAKFKALFPKLAALSQPPKAPLQNSNGGQKPSSAAIKTATTPSSSSSSTTTAASNPVASTGNQTNDTPLPTYSNQRRNQGLSGFMKYFQKNLDEPLIPLSRSICVEIEKFLFSRNSKGDELVEEGYKNDVKKLCTQFLDKEASVLLKQAIIEEYKTKKVGSLDSIKKILS